MEDCRESKQRNQQVKSVSFSSFDVQHLKMKQATVDCLSKLFFTARSCFQYCFSRQKKTKLNFDDKKFVLLAQRQSIRNVGFWPGDDNIKKWQIAFAIVSVVELLVFVTFQFRHCFSNTDDLAEFLRGLLASVSQGLIALKLLVIIVKRRDFKRIIDFILKAFDDGEL